MVKNRAELIGKIEELRAKMAPLREMLNKIEMVAYGRADISTLK